MIDSRYYQRRIQQKLMFAQQLINANQSTAFVEAAVMHLSIAYKAWLKEICSDKHHPLKDAIGVTATELANTSSVHIPSALSECVQLESNDTWLASLLQAIALSSSEINKPPVKIAAGLIPLNQSPEPVLPTAQEVGRMIIEFEALVSRYREAMQEF